MKYQKPKLHPMNESFNVHGACLSGNETKLTASCLTGVSAAQTACANGVHPGRACVSGTLPGNECASGAGDSEW